MDEEELEKIRKQSMAGLFLNFKVKKDDESQQPKKKPKKQQTKSGIAEDSMEDMVSDFDEDPVPT